MSYLAEIWCRVMHRSLMWPSHGHYQCSTCGREYPVPWELDLALGSRTIAHAAPVTGRS